MLFNKIQVYVDERLNDHEFFRISLLLRRKRNDVTVTSYKIRESFVTKNAWTLITAELKSSSWHKRYLCVQTLVNVWSNICVKTLNFKWSLVEVLFMNQSVYPSECYSNRHEEKNIPLHLLVVKTLWVPISIGLGEGNKGEIVRSKLIGY